MVAKLVAAAGLVAALGAAGCVVPALGTQLSESELPRQHAVYRIDWRAQIAPSTELGPIDLVVSRFSPLEASTPVVVPRHVGPKAEVVAGGSNGNLEAFSLRGQPLWEFEAGGPMGSPIADRGHVLVGCGNGAFYALSADDGSLVWTYATGEELSSAPVVTGNTVLILSNSDTLFALDADTGKWLWRYRREATSHEFAVRAVSSPLVAGDLVVAGFSDGSVVALHTKDGAVVWQHVTKGGNDLQDTDGTPQTDGQRVFVANYKEGLSALSLQDGHILWQRALPTASHLKLDRGTLFASSVGKVAAFNAYDGTPLWQKGLGASTATGMLPLPGMLVLSTEGPMLFLDVHTGRPLGRAFAPGRNGISAAPGIYGRDFYVISNNGWLYAMHLL